MSENYEGISMDQVAKLGKELEKFFKERNVGPTDALDFLTSFMLTLVLMCFEGEETEGFDKIAAEMKLRLAQILKKDMRGLEPLAGMQ